MRPEFELGVELGGEAGDLGGGDFQAAEFFEDLGDAAGGNALEIHFGDGGLERAVGTGAGLEQRGAEDFRAAADLRDGEVELADGGLQGAGLEAVGVAVAGFGPFVGIGLEVAGALDQHGGIEQHLGDARESLAEPVLEKGVDGVVGEVIVRGSGHGWCCFGSHLQTSALAGHPQPSRTGRRPAKGPIPLRSIGPLAGVTGVSDFYRRDVAPADLAATNGVVHVIDRVVVPESLDGFAGLDDD